MQLYRKQTFECGFILLCFFYYFVFPVLLSVLFIEIWMCSPTRDYHDDITGKEQN